MPLIGDSTLYESQYVSSIEIRKTGEYDSDCLVCGSPLSDFFITISSGICYHHVTELRENIEDICIRGREEECDSSIHEAKMLWSTGFPDNDKVELSRCVIRYPKRKDLNLSGAECDVSGDISLKNSCDVCSGDISSNQLMMSLDIDKIKDSGVRESNSAFRTHLTCMPVLRKSFIELYNQQSDIIVRTI